MGTIEENVKAIAGFPASVRMGTPKVRTVRTAQGLIEVTQVPFVDVDGKVVADLVYDHKDPTALSRLQGTGPQRVLRFAMEV